MLLFHLVVIQCTYPVIEVRGLLPEGCCRISCSFQPFHVGIVARYYGGGHSQCVSAAADLTTTSLTLSVTVRLRARESQEGRRDRVCWQPATRPTYTSHCLSLTRPVLFRSVRAILKASLVQSRGVMRQSALHTDKDLGEASGPPARLFPAADHQAHMPSNNTLIEDIRTVTITRLFKSGE